MTQNQNANMYYQDPTSGLQHISRQVYSNHCEQMGSMINLEKKVDKALYSMQEAQKLLRNITDVKIECIYSVDLDAMYGCESFYFFKLVGDRMPIVITKKDFENPKKIMIQLSQGLQVPLGDIKTKAAEVRALQQRIAANSYRLKLPFYEGWQKTPQGWLFQLRGGSTHGMRAFDPTGFAIMSEPTVVDISPTTALTASEQVAGLLECFENSQVRGVIALWLHVAALYSLLEGHGYRPAMGLYVYSDSKLAVTIIEKIMSWYQDIPISMAEPSRVFRNHLQERKDQPLLLVDAAGTGENAGILLSALKIGAISCRDKCTPLQALPTVIGSVTTALNASSLLLPLEVFSNDLSRDAFSRVKSHLPYLAEYIHGFIAFASSNNEMISRALSETADQVYGDQISEEFTLEAVNMMIVLYAVERIVHHYHAFLNPSSHVAKKLADMLSSEAVYNTTYGMFMHAMNCGSSDDLLQCFAAILQKKLRRGDFCYISKDGNTKKSQGNDGKVYFDDSYLYLDRDAFSSMVQACSASSPTVLRALETAGMLYGRPVNTETRMTRIKVRDAENMSTVIRVYKISQEDIENKGIEYHE